MFLKLVPHEVHIFLRKITQDFYRLFFDSKIQLFYQKLILKIFMNEEQLLNIFNETRKQALAPKTIKAYEQHFHKYENFMRTNCPLTSPEPVTLRNLKLFLAYRYNEHCSFNTVCADITAFAYYFRSNHLQDLTQDPDIRERAPSKTFNDNHISNFVYMYVHRSIF